MKNNSPAAARGSAAGLFGLLIIALVSTGCSSGGSGIQPQPPAPPEVYINPAGDTAMNPATPITVHAKHGTLADVAVTNADKGNQVTGNLTPDKTTWTSSEPLGYASTYRVLAHAAGDHSKPAEQQATITTVAPQTQAEPNLIPSPKSTAQSGVGVGQPIAFQFNAPVRNKEEVQKRLAVESEPHQEGAWYWIDDKNVHYRPKEYWKPGTRLKVSARVYGVDFGNGVFGAEDREETYQVHDSWIAKADGNTEQMQVFHNGQLAKTMPISMGKDATPTHTGAHVISQKQANYTMDSCTFGVCQGQPGYYRNQEKFSQRISNDGEFVHENPSSLGQQGSTNVSHGCINLNAENAKWFFDNLGLGDIVEVANSGGPNLPVYDLYGDWSLPWPQWQTGGAK